MGLISVRFGNLVGWYENYWNTKVGEGSWSVALLSSGVCESGGTSVLEDFESYRGVQSVEKRSPADGRGARPPVTFGRRDRSGRLWMCDLSSFRTCVTRASFCLYSCKNMITNKWFNVHFCSNYIQTKARFFIFVIVAFLWLRVIGLFIERNWIMKWLKGI